MIKQSTTRHCPKRFCKQKLIRLEKLGFVRTACDSFRAKRKSIFIEDGNFGEGVNPPVSSSCAWQRICPASIRLFLFHSLGSERLALLECAKLPTRFDHSLPVHHGLLGNVRQFSVELVVRERFLDHCPPWGNKFRTKREPHQEGKTRASATR